MRTQHLRFLVGILGVAIVGLTLAPGLVGAQGGPGWIPSYLQGQQQGQQQPTDIPAVLGRIQGWLTTVLFILAAVFIVIAAYFYLTAQGNAEKIKTAHNMVLYTVIAVIVAALASVVVGVARYFAGN